MLLFTALPFLNGVAYPRQYIKPDALNLVSAERGDDAHVCSLHLNTFMMHL